ncbi:MAG: hypothetical protein V2A75_01765 [Pseudomonadota bacterium]
MSGKENQSSEDNFNEARLTNRGYETLFKAQQSINVFSNKNAHNYFRHGVIVRLCLIIESRNLLVDLISKKNGNRTDTTLENIYLNSMYINMIATFDNVAWALQHEHNLIEGANENNPQKREIGIYNTKFFEKLRIEDENLHINLKVYKAWYEKLKDFRDPVAHRIPLYCPPISITDAKEFEEYNNLNTKLSEVKYKDNPQQYMELVDKLHHIGSFQPVFIVLSENEILSYDLRKTTHADYKSFLEVMDMFFTWISKRERGQAELNEGKA